MKDQLSEYDRQVLYEVSERVKKMAGNMERTQIADYIQLMHHPWRIFVLNLVGGTARGIGIAIGVTVFTSTILYILQGLGALNLPIIGDYIAQLVDIVQSKLDTRTYR
ncbi:DUF5665 domain-containing protein [Gorillibacterium massiliense]|uniref:DUF5665 domain-containing protein n=1 Tax=Gorillibacterium massiliense TaxID=1280390 RepID=UPI0004B4B921|nr:DUF5665 domain-containing protein [Gorillibacterium massiliense]